MSEHLEELKKRLYKEGESFDARLDRPELTPHVEKPPLLWKEGDTDVPMAVKKSRRSWRFVWIILFILAVGGGWFYFSLFYNAISPKKIEIKVSAPESVPGGDRVSWDILVTNNNRKALEAADFLFEYPAGSEILDDGVRGSRAKKTIGSIGSGETVRLSFNAYVFGFENEEKKTHATLEYRGEGSNAILSKEETTLMKILRSPVGLSIELPTEAKAGQEMEVKINYVSNSAGDLNNLVLEVELPEGFLAKSADPEPEAGGRLWLLPALSPGRSGTIVLKGILNGGELEEKSFKASVGVRRSAGDFSVYGQSSATVSLRRPFLEVDAKISGKDSYSARPGELTELEITYKNNLGVSVKDVVLEGVLVGSGFDEKQIRVNGGIYRASDKKIIFNSSSEPKLKQLNPGDSGLLRVQIGMLNSITPKKSTDKELRPNIKFSIRPGSAPPGYSGTDTTGEDTMEIKLISRLQLVRKGMYYASPIQNSGPLPPKVGNETTYTITWALTNSTNDLRNVTVKAILPSYVSWKGKTLPSDAPLTFDSNTGEVVWNVGDLKAGVGYISPAREIKFQIGFIPSPSQVGQTPDLVSKVSSEGLDVFTDSVLMVEAPAESTKMDDDSKVDLGKEAVVN